MQQQQQQQLTWKATLGEQHTSLLVYTPQPAGKDGAEFCS